jgi:hypothetical protein
VVATGARRVCATARIDPPQRSPLSADAVTTVDAVSVGVWPPEVKRLPPTQLPLLMPSGRAPYLEPPDPARASGY